MRVDRRWSSCVAQRRLADRYRIPLRNVLAIAVSVPRRPAAEDANATATDRHLDSAVHSEVRRPRLRQGGRWR
jgi:hypothetical protein